MWRNTVVPPRVRNKEQKIDRLLSFMFLRRRETRPFVRPSPLSRLPSPLLVLRIYTADIFLSFSLSFVATYNKTNRGNSTRRAMGKEPGGMQKNAKETGRPRGRERVQSRKGRKGREAGEERTRDTCTRKKSKSPGPWKPDGIAFVVCYRSSRFFGWE